MWCDFWGSANFLASSSRQMAFSVNRGLGMRHKASSAIVMAGEPIPLTLAPEGWQWGGGWRLGRQRAMCPITVDTSQGCCPDLGHKMGPTPTSLKDVLKYMMVGALYKPSEPQFPISTRQF